MLWLLGGAAAIIAGASTARSGGIGRYRAAATANGYPTVVSALRSWLPRGGSERARIGNSQYVLINDPTSPREYVFHENVPPGGHMSVTPDGTATIYNKDGQPVGTIAKPWAYDSLGHPQKTWYTVDNNGNLVQHIDPESNALYPILADPPEPPDLPIGMMSGSDTKPSDVTGSGTATAPATPPPPVEQSSIANSPAISALPTLSEPADPPDPSTLPPVEQSPISNSPAISALPTISEPAPPDPSTLPPVEQSPVADSPAVQALPTLSGTGEPGSSPETISSGGLVWTRISPDPSVFPSGLPEGQSFWTTTVDNRTITVQTIASPDGTTTIISNGVLRTYDNSGNLLGTFAPDPGQALADPIISLAATALIVAARGGALGEAVSARTQFRLFKSLNRLLTPKPTPRIGIDRNVEPIPRPSQSQTRNPSGSQGELQEGTEPFEPSRLNEAVKKALPKSGDFVSDITNAVQGTGTPTMPPVGEPAQDPVSSIVVSGGFLLSVLIKALRSAYR